MASDNWKRCSLASILLILLAAAPARAQSQELAIGKIHLGSSPCSLSAGSGSPEGAVAGKFCDTYFRTDGTSFDTLLYIKSTASGTSGWVSVPMLWTRSGSYTYLTNSGDTVGIGISTPAYKLQVGGTIAPVLGYASDLGAYIKKWLTVHAAELRVETLVAADTMATIGGRINVAPTTQLTSNLAAAATTIEVKHSNLAQYDRVRMEADGKVEWMAITSTVSGTGPYYYNVTRNLDGSGADDWYAGDAVLNTGTTGDGYIDLYSDRSTRSASHYGPTIVGNVRTGSTYYDLDERWAIGNLNGLYGYATDIYGAAFGSKDAAWVKIDPTYGVRLGHNTTTKVQIDGSGNASFSGSVTAAAGAIGGWTIGATSLTASAGDVGMSSAQAGANDIRFWAGNSSPGSAPFRVSEIGQLVASDATITGAITATSGAIGGWTIGASGIAADTNNVGLSSEATAGNDVRIWAGGTAGGTAPFNVYENGSVTATAGTIGGWTLGSTFLKAGSGATTVGLDSGGTNPALYAGSATPASAPFRVTSAGALTATSATITGTINATAGYFGDSSNDVSIDSSGVVVGSSGRISAGGGAVTIDADGIEITGGQGDVNALKWSDGNSIASYNNNLSYEANGTHYFYGTGYQVSLSSSVFTPDSSTHPDLGASGTPWRNLYLDGDIYSSSISTTTDADYPVVWSGSNYKLRRKTNGGNGNLYCSTGIDTVVAELGMTMSVLCLEPEVSGAVLKTRVDALESEVAALKAQVAALVALLGGKQ